MVQKPQNIQPIRALPTQKDIAQILGISRETVSQILGGKGAHRYNEETRKKVHHAAKKLGYHPHKGAQIMRRGRSNLIGIIHFGMRCQVARKAAHYLPQLITENGYHVFTLDLSWHGASYRMAIDQLVDMRVEGVVILQQTESFGPEEVEILTRAGIPTIVMAGDEQLGVPTVLGDSLGAFTKMTEHLYAVGHRSMLLLTNDYEKRPTLNRIAGFKKAIAQFSDVESEVVRMPAEGDAFDAGTISYAYTKKLLKSNALPDAILCSDDQWARGVFSACLEAGLKVPGDIAITGFDNDAFGAYAPYYLTTSEPDIALEATITIKLLTKMMKGTGLTQQQYVYPCKMIFRRSCGAIFDHANINQLSTNSNS